MHRKKDLATLVKGQRWDEAATKWPTQLFDRDAFCEISRLVDVGALEHGGVISEKLNRDRIQQWSHERRTLRDRDAKGAAGCSCSLARYS